MNHRVMPYGSSRRALSHADAIAPLGLDDVATTESALRDLLVYFA
jgi:hypothetical protein